MRKRRNFLSRIIKCSPPEIIKIWSFECKYLNQSWTSHWSSFSTHWIQKSLFEWKWFSDDLTTLTMLTIWIWLVKTVKWRINKIENNRIAFLNNSSTIIFHFSNILILHDRKIIFLINSETLFIKNINNSIINLLISNKIKINLFQLFYHSQNNFCKSFSKISTRSIREKRQIKRTTINQKTTKVTTITMKKLKSIWLMRKTRMISIKSLQKTFRRNKSNLNITLIKLISNTEARNATKKMKRTNFEFFTSFSKIKYVVVIAKLFFNSTINCTII